MRRLRLFLSKFVLSLWIVLFGSFLFLLVVESRGGGVNKPIAGVFIRESATTVALPNRIFTCTETKQLTQCQATIQDLPLVLSLTPYKDDEPDAIRRDCQATYDGQLVKCTSQYLQYAPMLSESFEIRELALGPQQLQAVQRKYWGIRALLTLGERRLMRLSTGLSIAAGAIAAYFAWFRPSRLTKGLASVVWGFMAYILVWSFLGSVQFATVIPYGFTVDSWMWAATYGPVVIGIAAAITVALLLKRKAGRTTKTIVTLSNTIGSVLMVNTFLLLVLLGAGFAD
ncbi:MAG: hypothetical protein AAFQ63_08085 [Cyanobacteria bacterium J06621_11]